MSSLLISCSKEDSITNSETAINVSLKMEAILYNTDPVPQPYRRTTAYLYYSIQNSEGLVTEDVHSETTTCPNGWAVQEINKSLNENEKIILGVTTIYPPEFNYKYEEITFRDLQRFADESGNVEFVKTMTIYE